MYALFILGMVNDEQNSCWYAIRTYHCKEMQLVDYLQGRGLSCFVPMTYVKNTNADSMDDHRLVPAIHNFVFVRKTLPDRDIQRIFQECCIMMSVYKNEHNEYYEISNHEMNEIRFLCDPSFADVKIIDSEEAEAKTGKEVVVVQGPFKGLQGKLIRQQRRYYFIKTVIGIGIMVRISRWYCKVIA